MPSESIGWIRDTGRLSDALAGLRGGPLALDTEADSLHHYPEKVCLVQLSFGGADHLVDPLAGVDLAPLGRVLGDAAVTKILHGSDYDLRVLQRDFRLELVGLFDTMIAARLTGERAFGLAALLETHFGITLEKKFQRADWSRRPLTPEMETYAALDTRHLEALAERLAEQLRRLGRTAWAEEEFRALECVRWSDPDPENAVRRVKGSATLDRRERAVLRELIRMREAEARRRDRPPFRILSAEHLLQVARARPETPAALRSIRELPRSWTSGGHARSLHEAVRRGLDLPEDQLQEPRRPRPRRKLSSRQELRLRKLRDARNELAEKLDVEPGLVAPRDALKDIVLRLEEGRPVETPLLRSWQLGLLRPLLKRA